MMEQEVIAPEVGDEEQTPQAPPQGGDEKLRALHDAVSKDYDIGDFDSFKQKLQNPEKRKAFYEGIGNDYQLGSYDDFEKKIGVVTPPEHHVQHSPLQDIRHLNDLATVPDYAPEQNAAPGGFVVNTHQQEQKLAKQQAQTALDNQAKLLGEQWGVDPKIARQAVVDFGDESDENKLKGFAQLYKENPVAYGRLKSSNDIRMAIAKNGPDGVHDANIYNHLQDASNYDQLQDNIHIQQELMTKHGLGQEYWEKMKQATAPLINTLDPGLLHQYWNSDDHKLGISDFQYAGLQTEKFFNPDKYKQDLAIIRENKGLDEGGNPRPEGQAKKGYEYDRGVENVLFGLERQGRQNTAQYISQHQVELGKQLTQLKDDYQTRIKNATDPEEQKRLLQEFQSSTLIQQAGILEEGQQAIDYAQSEDQRKFPLNYSDMSTKLVKDAMDGTTGLIGNTGKFVGNILTGAGQASDNTIRFIKNSFINILGSESSKAAQHAKDIGHQSLTELANYEPESYTGTQSPLLIPDELKKQVQGIMDDNSLSHSEKEQKSISLVRDHFDNIKVNPKAGQQNLTGKAALFTAANTLGQILGVADQSLLMGGLLGNASKVQQLTNALVPMYASTQNQLYEQALARGDENPLLKSNIDAAIISLASLINPDFKVVKGMIGAETGLGKMIAGIDEAGWNKILSENSSIVNKLQAGTKATAKQLGLANLQYGIIVPSAQYLVHKNVLNEDANLGDMILDGMKQATVSMAIPALTHGIWGGIRANQVNPQQKYALVEMGLHPQENIDLLNGQIERGQIMPSQADQLKDVIKSTGEILKNGEFVKTDGTPMNEKEVADAVYNQLRKKVLEGKLRNAAEPNKPLIEAKIHEINQDISDLHTSDDQKHKTELNKLLTDNLERIKRNMPAFEGPIRDAIAENKPEEVLQMIADQATETTKVDGKEVSSRAATEEIFGKELVEKAIELSKKKPEKPANIETETKKPRINVSTAGITNIKLKDNAIQEPSTSSLLQHPQEGVGGEGSGRGGVESGQQGEIPAGESGEPVGQGENGTPNLDEEKGGGVAGKEVTDELPFGRSDEVGISHERQIERSYDVKLTEPERGQGITLNESIQKGRDLIKEGTDPNKVAEDFHKSKKLSWEDMSVVRAQNEINAKATNAAIDKYGIDSPEAKAAIKVEDEWRKNNVKPMQTEWSKIGVTQQGATDIETGSVNGLRRAFKDLSGKDFSPEQEKKAKDLSEKVTTLTEKQTELQGKIDKLVSENAKLKEDKSIKESAKDLAAKIRKGKTNRPDTFSAASPASLVWDAAVEIVASAVEAGGTLAQAVADGVAHIKESDWYKGLTDEEKNVAESEFTDWHMDAEKPAKDIAEKYASKKGNKFSTDEAKEIWGYIKENYLDKGKELPDAIKGASVDLGLTAEQILHAMATPKGAKEITTEMFKVQYERRKAINSARYFVANADKSKLGKAINKIPSIFFNLKTWGHGTVGNITHAGPNIFRPSTWKAYWPNVLKSFGLAYGSTANFEKAVTILKSSPHFDEWIHAGLAADPNKVYDEYQLMGKPKKNSKTGQAIQWLNETGTRGFTGLNFMRYDMAEMLYNRASDAAKADPEFRTQVAELVNHATGHSEVKVPKAIKVITFAPGLEISRWQRMITDPVKAAKTFATWGKASDADKAAAKIVAGGAGEKIALYGTLLAANSGLLSAIGSRQSVNISDPTKSDWLRFKFAGRTLDVSGNILSPYRLLSVLVGQAYIANTAAAKDIKGKPGDKDANTLVQQGRYKLSPVAGTVTDLGTGTDAMGNTLPWSDVKPAPGRHKMDWKELISKEALPIPVAAGLEAYWHSMKENGMSDDQIGGIMNGLLLFGVEGFTGAKLQEDFSLGKGEKSKVRTTSRAK